MRDHLTDMHVVDITALVVFVIVIVVRHANAIVISKCEHWLGLNAKKFNEKSYADQIGLTSNGVASPQHITHTKSKVFIRRRRRPRRCCRAYTKCVDSRDVFIVWFRVAQFGCERNSSNYKSIESIAIVTVIVDAVKMMVDN